MAAVDRPQLAAGQTCETRITSALLQLLFGPPRDVQALGDFLLSSAGNLGVGGGRGEGELVTLPAHLLPLLLPLVVGLLYLLLEQQQRIADFFLKRLLKGVNYVTFINF